MVSEKKEIVYNNIKHFAVIVASGVYKNVQYVCLNLGIHPAAYVMCTQEFLDKHVDKYKTIDGIHVHCGITYVGKANELLGLEEYNSPCFGWDYGHAGDWAGYMSEEENIAFNHTKYTTDMLIKDCQDAIDQYLQILENDAHPADTDIITKEALINLGFTKSHSSGFDDRYQISGEKNGKIWKIIIDLKNPSSSYVLTQNSRRKYEGEITTVSDLKSIIQLFDIPVEIK